MSQDSFTAADVRDATQSLETTVTFLKSHGLLAELQKCVCQAAMKWNKRNDVKDGYTWRCPRVDCRKKVSIRHQSFFFRFKLQLPVALESALLWAAEVPVSRIRTVTNTAMSVKCVCQHYEYYREICTGILSSNDKTLVLGRYGKKVHVNPCVYRVSAKAPGEPDKWVLGIYDFETRSASLIVALDNDIKMLYEFVQTHSHPSTIVCTDFWNEMRTTAKEMGGDASHKRQYIEPQFAGRVYADATKYWAYVMSRLSSVRPTEKSQLWQYLDEIMWRAKYGRNEKREFDENVALRNVLEAMSKQYPVVRNP